MNTITISSKIENGVIHLPENYKKYENAQVFLVIILDNEKYTQKQALSDIFEKMQGVNMFESIENPVEWQKKLRNNWE